METCIQFPIIDFRDLIEYHSKQRVYLYNSKNMLRSWGGCISRTSNNRYEYSVKRSIKLMDLQNPVFTIKETPIYTECKFRKFYCLNKYVSKVDICLKSNLEKKIINKKDDYLSPLLKKYLESKITLFYEKEKDKRNFETIKLYQITSKLPKSYLYSTDKKDLVNDPIFLKMSLGGVPIISITISDKKEYIISTGTTKIVDFSKQYGFNILYNKLENNSNAYDVWIFNIVSPTYNNVYLLDCQKALFDIYANIEGLKFIVEYISKNKLCTSLQIIRKLKDFTSCLLHEKDLSNIVNFMFDILQNKNGALAKIQQSISYLKDDYLESDINILSKSIEFEKITNNIEELIQTAKFPEDSPEYKVLKDLKVISENKNKLTIVKFFRDNKSSILKYGPLTISALDFLTKIAISIL